MLAGKLSFLIPLPVFCELAKKIDLKAVWEGLKRCLGSCLDTCWDPTSSWTKSSTGFSRSNPIDRIVNDMKAQVEREPHICLLEACSGSGKSLCAADFFVRNAGESIYFLLSVVQGNHDNMQSNYSEVEPITRLVSTAMDCNLCTLTKHFVGSGGTTGALTGLDINFNSGFGKDQKWYVLGVLC